MFRFRALAAGACTALAAVAALPATTAVAAPPAPCNNAPQITDPSGDGHHPPTDVLAAWWSEANGRLQAVIQVARRDARWPSTTRPQIPACGVRVGLRRRSARRAYVRAIARLPVRGTPTFDYGTYTGVGGFTSAGPTTGAVESGPGQAGRSRSTCRRVAAGTRLLGARSSITWDGINGSEVTWVDHAPGGVSRPTRRAAPTTSSAPAGAVLQRRRRRGGVRRAAAVGVRAYLRPARRAQARHGPQDRDRHRQGPARPARACRSRSRARRRRRADEQGHQRRRRHVQAARIAIGETTRLRATAEGIGSRRADRSPLAER